MNKIRKALIVAALVSFSGTAFGDLVRISSPGAATGYQGLNSAGVSLTEAAAGTYTFEAGVFSEGFDSAAPFGDWEANFTSVGSATWLTSPPFAAGRFQNDFSVADAALTGEQAFIWGSNSKAIDPASEWVVLTNENWIFPTPNPLALAPSEENQWSVGDEGTAVFGDMGSLIDANGGNDGFQMTAIPEPSTYALIFGFGVLGLVIVRRVRAQK
ncbi:MAG: PEP-CTERM sorting domain-containing protein [Opitutales bacterium]